MGPKPFPLPLTNFISLYLILLPFPSPPHLFPQTPVTSKLYSTFRLYIFILFFSFFFLVFLFLHLLLLLLPLHHKLSPHTTLLATQSRGGTLGRASVKLNLFYRFRGVFWSERNEIGLISLLGHLAFTSGPASTTSTPIRRVPSPPSCSSLHHHRHPLFIFV